MAPLLCARRGGYEDLQRPRLIDHLGRGLWSWELCEVAATMLSAC